MKDIKVKVVRDNGYVYPDKKEFGITGENLQGNLIFELDEFVDGDGYVEIDYGYIHHLEYVCFGNESGAYEISGENLYFTMPEVAKGNRLLYYPTIKKMYIEIDKELTEIALSEGEQENKLTFEEISKTFYELTKEDETYKLPIYSSLLLQESRIYLNLRIDEIETNKPVFKSHKFYLDVVEGINAISEDIAYEYPSWIGSLSSKLEATDIVAGSNITVEVDGRKVIISGEDSDSSVKDVKVNGTSVVGSDKIANVSVPTKTSDLTNDSNFVEDANYVHTDNNYTYAEKTKLAGLKNYDDTEIKVEIKDIQDAQEIDETNISANTSSINSLAGRITTIEDKIPTQATSTNQLADKEFVNSSIATNTANFIGTFNSVAELEAYVGIKTNNDYAFVKTTDSAGNVQYNRYKFVASSNSWVFEYTLNNSSFTANQWVAINSGITSDLVTYYNGLEAKIPTKTSQLTNDSNYVKKTDTEITNKELLANKTTTIDSSSTDTQYPSAKAVYTMIGDVESILETLTTGSGV